MFAVMNRTFAVMLIAVAMLLSGCGRIITEPGTETVLVDKPFLPSWLVTGGVREETQKKGSAWYWWTTYEVAVTISPIRYDEPLEHLPTADNNFINYASYVVLQWKDPAYLVEKFGYVNWYENNLQAQYRTIVRNVSKKYSMTKIMTDPPTLTTIENEISDEFRKHIKSTGLHVDLINVNMGRVLPNEAVVVEMDNTAVAQQNIKTQLQRKAAEDARLAAEQSRANADNAYREAMHLDAAQFVALEAIKRYSEACIKSSCVIVQGGTPVLVGK
jgi:regulator of protease activity HflC (stomatin/prohibitin superfamily)